MWTCPYCGEPHEDQFKICWKCTSDELAGPMTGVVDKEKTPTLRIPSTPAAPVERKVRPLSGILFRVFIAFIVGLVLGAASAPRIGRSFFSELGDTFADAITFGLIVGAVFAGIVGLALWVVFPYEAIRERDGERNHGEE